MQLLVLKEGSSLDVQLFSHGLHVLIVRKLSPDGVKQ